MCMYVLAFSRVGLSSSISNRTYFGITISVLTLKDDIVPTLSGPPDWVNLNQLTIQCLTFEPF